MSKRKNCKRIHNDRYIALQISPELKPIVWERDNYCCIICGQPVPKSCANAHYINRSQGGMGIEKNIVTLCPKCHFEDDNGLHTQEYQQKIKEYLQSKYEDWNEEDLIYKKYN